MQRQKKGKTGEKAVPEYVERHGRGGVGAKDKDYQSLVRPLKFAIAHRSRKCSHLTWHHRTEQLHRIVKSAEYKSGASRADSRRYRHNRATGSDPGA